VSLTIFGPPSAETGTDGGGTVVGFEPVVVVAVVVDLVDRDGAPAVVVVADVVDVGPGRFAALLLHALSIASAAIIAIEPSRSRRTQRS
jgi:hypothetical protein